MAERRNASHVASRWEWVAAAASAALVLSILAVLVAEVAGTRRAPDLTARVDSISPRTGHFLAHLTIRNAGSETAAALLVEGELALGDSIVERSTARLDYVPGYGSRGAALLFTRDPRRHQLRVRPTGFERP